MASACAAAFSSTPLVKRLPMDLNKVGFMTYPGALAHLQSMGKVARALWPDGNFVRKHKSGAVYYCEPNGEVIGVWIFSADDCVADDWKIIL